MSGRCDVIIPVKNGPAWLALCLEELLRSAGADELGQALVVDDGSSAQAFAVLQRICAQHRAVRLLRNTGRKGFGGACNFGARHATAPHLLFLNTDCLITRGAIGKLLAACEADPAIGMASPLSNNSATLTLPLAPGRSYVEMNALLERACLGLTPAQAALDACTVVGNCLLITRRCWEQTGQFDETWGLGYGEESDFQMRAAAQGFRGAALINTYVYHFGNATFRHEAGANELREKNHKLFIEKWGDRYKALLARQEQHDPAALAAQRLAALPPQPVAPAVLFLLPGIAQAVGGVQVAIAICNHLVRQGLEAECAVLGELSQDAVRTFQEPILFGLLHFPDELDLLEQTEVAPQCVAATSHTTAAPGYVFARLHGIPLVHFVQGYECVFRDGTDYNRVVDAYALADHLLVTSNWLRSRVQAHASGKPLTVLPIGVDPYLFSAGTSSDRSPGGKVRVGLVLRDAPDKGQWILLEVLRLLAEHKEAVSLTVFSFERYELPRGWEDEPECLRVQLPADRAAIADNLRACDVFLDASLHEGFGLFPLEAMACGATVVVSDSGGVNEYVRHGVNGIIVSEVNNPEQYVQATLALAQDRPRLEKLKAEAARTAASFAAPAAYDRYAEFFRHCRRGEAAAPAREEKALLRTLLGTMRDAAERRASLKLREHDALCRVRGAELEALEAKLAAHERAAQAGDGAAVARLSAQVLALQLACQAKDRQVAELEGERARIISGASFRVGRVLTAPLRALLGKR